MPNYVVNVIKMKGIKDLPLFDFVEDKYTEGGIKKVFDFNKLIPMPESLNMTAGSTEGVAIEAVMRKLSVHRFYGKDYKTMTDEEFQERMKGHGKTEEELIELGLQYISNKVRYGATTWYDWNIAHWGTKWNACDYKEREDEEDTIEFQTAWSCPEPILMKLAEMYPDAHIEHWWADEDMGSNCGYKEFVDGQWYGDYHTSQSNEAYETYIYCWGETNCLKKDVEGNWYYRGCDGCDGCN